MKTSQDPRHLKREKAIRALFQYSYTEKPGSNPLAGQVVEQLPRIDELIQKSAPEWPLIKLNRIDLAILRLAVYELLNHDNPSKVVIDEAIELAKQYGAENSPKFVNGALGTALKLIEEANPTPEDMPVPDSNQ